MTLYNDESDVTSFDAEITRRLLGYLKPFRRNIMIALLASLLSVAGSVFGPPIVSYAIDQGVQQRDLAVVAAGVVAYIALQGLGALGFMVQIRLMAQAGQGAIQQLRNDLFRHINELSISFFGKYRTGRLIARVINDVNTLREAIVWAIVGTFRDLLVLIGTVIAMCFINLPLTLVAFGVLVTLGIIVNFWRVYARASYLQVVETNTRVNSELAEAFNGVRVTQAYNRQRFNQDRFAQQINYNNRQANIRATLVAALFFPSIELVGGVATGLLITVGGSLVLGQQLSIFTLLSFVLYVDQFFQPIRMLAQRYNLFQSVMAAGDKLFYLLDRPVEVQDAPNALEMPPIQGNVRFEDVTFTYQDEDEDEDATVLSHINLNVPAGSSVALVGHTGAGKSTLVKLVMRFYDPTEGRVLIDGIDIRTVTQSSLRGQMGIVPQETYLFSGTVMDNLRYGRLNATDDEIIEAAKAVGAHDFIMKLENGYRTEVREGGTLLSQGQKQLLAFARALLANPRILILDEATSNIDTQTEKLIQTALGRLLEGRTSFVIAHRLSTIIHSDLIVVMDHGQIIEQGTHQELLAQDGAYRGLYTLV